MPNRIGFKIASLTFKSLTLQQLEYLSSLRIPYSSGRSLRSTGQHLLSVPCTSTAIQSRAFSTYAPQLWNRLPQSLRDLAFTSHIPLDTDTLTSPPSYYPSNHLTFRHGLKTFLFDCPPKSLIPWWLFHGASVINLCLVPFWVMAPFKQMLNVLYCIVFFSLRPTSKSKLVVI